MTGQQPSLTLVRRIRATPARVYAAWTAPEQVARWFGPDAGPVLSAETDVRPGGRFRIVFRTQDGEQHDVRGRYREVEAERRLVFTWQWVTFPDRESLVTIELRPVPEGTELTLTHARFFDEAVRDAHRQGWGGALDKLQALLEQD
ncbi:MAG: SRPBCC domain-containing protein [Dongiaceae bacterium]